MKHVVRAIFFLLLVPPVMTVCSPPSAFAESGDPYSRIEKITEPNGMRILLSPQEAAKNFQIRIEVKAGFAAESKELAGVSHLLEHYLFTDARLTRDMTYAEVIREKGGDGNAETSKLRTVYFATVPAGQAGWLTTVFAKMIFSPVFESSRVEQVRKPVVIEIGRPGFLDYLAYFGLANLAENEIFRDPDYWESEFGLYHQEPFRGSDRINTTRLRAEDLRAYFEQYYWPGNITVYISGHFDPVVLRPLVDKLFGAAPGRRGKSLEDRPLLARDAPYLRSESTSDMPRISYGQKLWEITQKDELTLRVYLDYVAHRLMKEIRNKRGNTYTAYADLEMVRNDGYAAINMDSPPEEYYGVLTYLKNMLKTEAVDGGLSEKQFQEATDLYASTFVLKEHDSGTALRLAWELNAAEKAYGTARSPYLVFKSLKYPEFVATLRRLFRPDRLYSNLVEPPLFFRYEFAALIFLLLMGLGFGAERVFSNRFEHGKIRMVRKLVFPPVYVLQIVVTLLAVFSGCLGALAVNRLGDRLAFIQRSFLGSDYLLVLLGVVVLFSTIIFALSLIKRKLIVCGDALYIKSLTYRSTRIPLAEIAGVELLAPRVAMFSPSRFWWIKYRYYYYDYVPWRKGLCLTLKNGRSYFFGFDDAKAVKAELEHVLGEQTTSPVALSRALPGFSGLLY